MKWAASFGIFGKRGGKREESGRRIKGSDDGGGTSIPMTDRRKKYAPTLYFSSPSSSICHCRRRRHLWRWQCHVLFDYCSSFAEIFPIFRMINRTFVNLQSKLFQRSGANSFQTNPLVGIRFLWHPERGEMPQVFKCVRHAAKEAASESKVWGRSRLRGDDNSPTLAAITKKFSLSKVVAILRIRIHFHMNEKSAARRISASALYGHFIYFTLNLIHFPVLINQGGKEREK